MKNLYTSFLENDYAIIALHHIQADGSCGCGNFECSNAGKHPAATRWQSTPVWSDDQIATMEEMGMFATGYGVLMRGLMVIDVDARNGGVESLKKLLDAVPEIAGAGLVVETGSGGGSRHYYYSVPGGDTAFLSHLPDYPGIDFKSSGFVVGPGSQHKSGGKYIILCGSVNDISPIPLELSNLLKKPDKLRTEISGHSIDLSSADLASMLEHIQPDDYDIWIRTGMALHEATGGAGLKLWDKWSQRSEKYNAAIMDHKWHSFGKSSAVVTFGTLAYYAQQGGWEPPVEFEFSGSFDTDDIGAGKNGLPVDISSVDILRPPGFVGELAHWIGQQTRRPRDYLAVAAALTSVGNIIGLNYQCEHTGVTGNLFSFCIAGSGTGKEAIQQAVIEIHRVAGLAPAVHGGIKSEQEILRNIAIRHQAAFYCIDEIGILLEKIKKAADRGGAIYLEGVIGLLMSAYTKSNGVLTIPGDLRENIRELISKQIAQQRKMQEERSDKFNQKILARLEKQYHELDQGVVNPFVSLIGFTTPETFDGLIDRANAVNGFIGRSLIFREHETVPKFRKNHTPPPMSDGMKNAIMMLASNGTMDIIERPRIEQIGERSKIPSTQDAICAMERIRDYFDEQAWNEKGGTGLESIFMRCYELVAKVAFIIASPSGAIELDHVVFSFALVHKELGKKLDVIRSGDDRFGAENAMVARIKSFIGEDGETQGILINRVNPKKRHEIIRLLETMVEKNKLRLIEEKNSRGRSISRYFLI